MQKTKKLETVWGVTYTHTSSLENNIGKIYLRNKTSLLQ